MTFAAKFEILESVTRGTVETFVARKIATDEDVLVHVFEAGEQPRNQPTVQWILEAFRAFAPDPCGRVVETGRYDATSYGYLVTKLPEKSLLQAWVQSYEARQQREAAIGGVKPPVSEETTQPVPDSSSESKQPTSFFGGSRPGEITTAFEGVRSELKPRGTADLPPSAVHPDHAERPAISGERPGPGIEGSPSAQPPKAGDFTRQFFPAFNGEHPERGRPSDTLPGGERAKRGSSTPSGEANEKGKGASAGSATETASAMLRRIVLPSTDSPKSRDADNSLRVTGSPQSKPVANAPPGKMDTSGMGEFTRFFHGPFDGEQSAKVSDFPPPTAREAKQTGEFTRLFGPAKADSSAGWTPLAGAKLGAAPASESSEPRSLTQRFEGVEVSRRIPSADDPDRRTTNTFEVNRTGSAGAKEPYASAPVSGPAKISGDVPLSPPFQDKVPSSSADLRFSFHSESEGATRVFSPEDRGFSFSSSTPAGPSEYTRIVAGGLRRTRALGESSPTAVPTPLVPQFPPVGGQPQVPVPPQVPMVPAAPVPVVATSAAKAARTPWAMILILNGLFVLAVLLVLYFVFRR